MKKVHKKSRKKTYLSFCACVWARLLPGTLLAPGRRRRQIDKAVVEQDLYWTLSLSLTLLLTHPLPLSLSLFCLSSCVCKLRWFLFNSNNTEGRPGPVPGPVRVLWPHMFCVCVFSTLIVVLKKNWLNPCLMCAFF